MYLHYTNGFLKGNRADQAVCLVLVILPMLQVTVHVVLAVQNGDNQVVQLGPCLAVNKQVGQLHCAISLLALIDDPDCCPAMCCCALALLTLLCKRLLHLASSACKMLSSGSFAWATVCRSHGSRSMQNIWETKRGKHVVYHNAAVQTCTAETCAKR